MVNENISDCIGNGNSNGNGSGKRNLYCEPYKALQKIGFSSIGPFPFLIQQIITKTDFPTCTHIINK